MLAIAGLFTSCELSEYNPSAGDSSIKSYDIWKGLQAYSYSALYDQLYSASDWMMVSEGGTDLWMAPGNSDSYQQILNYESLTTDYNSTKKVWQQAYSMTTNCNTVINMAESLIDGNQDEIDLLVAESKALRAFYNYIIVLNFGPVTLNLESSPSETGNTNVTPKRTSEKDFYDQIIKDLKEAIPVLGVEPYAGNRARMTKKAAMGILARVYAQRAGLGDSKTHDYNDGEVYWKLAAETAEELINNSGAYGAYLYTDIADMWADANNRNNKEALFTAVGGDPTGDAQAFAQAAKTNKLLVYSAGAAYDDFFNKNHKPSDKQSYFYGRCNSQSWTPSKYLLYCFNPEWDRRWEYSFIYGWSDFSMAAAGWVKYSGGQVKITQAMCDRYGIDPSHVGETIYPYVDCAANQVAVSAAGNQYTASIWPKGETSGDVNKLLKVAPSAAQMNQSGYAATTKAYAIPYPIEADDNRFNTVFVHEKPSDAEKAKSPYVVVTLSDLFGSNGLPYGNTSKGSDAGNPPAIGDGTTSAKVSPSFHKFNWSYDGVFMGGNLQIKNGDMYIIRMAEMYLIAAEARQKLGEDSKALGYLNTLRQRAARPGASENTWKLNSVSEDDIFDEYAREMCGEFNRWALLKRHNAFESRLERFNKRAANNFKSTYYNRPVSSDFLSNILNDKEYGDNGYGSTPTSGLEGFEK